MKQALVGIEPVGEAGAASSGGRVSDLPADLHPYVEHDDLWSFDPAAYGSRDRTWVDGYELRCYHAGPEHRWEILASRSASVIAKGTERSLRAARARALRVMHGFRASLGDLR